MTAEPPGGFKGTGHDWLPAVPVSWSMMPAKALFSDRREASAAEDEHLTPSQKYGVVTQAEYMEITGTRVVLNLAGADNMKRVRPGDFVIHLRSFQGGIERSAVAGKVSLAYTVLTPRALVHGPFFRWLLKSDRYVQALRVTVNQLRDGQSIRYQDFGKIHLPIPSLPEQRAIADYLDRETAKIDALIEKQTKLIDRLRERRTSVIVRAITGANDNSDHKDSGIYWSPRTPLGWDAVPLKHILESVQTGVWGSDEDGGVDDILCVRVADFDRPRLRVGAVPTVRSVPPRDRAKSGLQRGDILIEKSGGTAVNPVGFVVSYESEEPAVCANFIARLRVRSDHSSPYWLYALNGSYVSGLTWRSVKQTTGIQNLDMDAFLSEVFPVPPLDEQRQITEHLDRETARIDALIARAQRFIELARERRSALITAAVTGQIDITQGATS